MLNEVLTSSNPIALIIILGVIEAILAAILNHKVKIQKLSSAQMFLVLAGFNLLTGSLMYDVACVNMEVIDNHDWVGRFTDFESMSYFLRYFGLVDIVLGIIYIVRAFFEFFDKKLEALIPLMERAVYRGVVQSAAKPASNSAATQDAPNTCTPL